MILILFFISSLRLLDTGFGCDVEVGAKDELADLTLSSTSCKRVHGYCRDCKVVNSKSALWNSKVSWLFEDSDEAIFFTISERRTSYLALLENRYRSWINAVLFGVDNSVAHFIKALLTGQRPPIWLRLTESFKSLGIYHLLVVSGFHVHLFCAFAMKFFSLVNIFLTFLFGDRRPISNLFASIRPIISFAITTVVVALSGSGAPAQRAGVWHLFQQYKYSAKGVVAYPILYVLLLQAAFFPANFMSLSNVMSWTAFLSVRGYFKKTMHIKGLNRIYFQFTLMLVLSFMVAAYLGQFNLASPLVNFFLALIFTPLLIATGLVFSLGLLDLLPWSNLEIIGEGLNFLFVLSKYLKSIGLRVVLVESMALRLFSFLIVVLWVVLTNFNFLPKKVIFANIFGVQSSE